MFYAIDSMSSAQFEATGYFYQLSPAPNACPKETSIHGCIMLVIKLSKCTYSLKGLRGSKEVSLMQFCAIPKL